MKTAFFIGLCIIVCFVSFGTTLFLIKKFKTPITQPIPSQQVLGEAFTPSQIEYSLDPPAESLSGIVTKVTGKVQKNSRKDGSVVELLSEDIILEGEKITTYDNSLTTLAFNETHITLSDQTVSAFTSTHPKNFLIHHQQGTLNLITSSNIPTISVRSLRGLFTLSQGKATIFTDSDQDEITFSIEKGSGQLGYIDSDNNTQMVEISEGERVIFDNQRRTVKK